MSMASHDGEKEDWNVSSDESDTDESGAAAEDDSWDGSDEDDVKYDDKDVEKVTGVRRRDGKTEYRLKLSGHGGDTWEPAENVDCPGLVEKFHAERKKVARGKKTTNVVFFWANYSPLVTRFRIREFFRCRSKIDEIKEPRVAILPMDKLRRRTMHEMSRRRTKEGQLHRPAVHTPQLGTQGRSEKGQGDLLASAEEKLPR